MRIGRALQQLNAMPAKAAEEELLSCCGSRRWARRMAGARPFASESELLASADRFWNKLSVEDWLEAFAVHPRIGERASGRAAREQSGTRGASSEVIEGLARANREYEKRFGHIFIVCATGRSGEEMLDLCRRRLHNDPRKELAVAAEEQRKITRLRLEKLLRAP
jgi:OHCU decarboxylase